MQLSFYSKIKNKKPQPNHKPKQSPLSPPKTHKPTHLVYVRFIIFLYTLRGPCIDEALLRMIWGVVIESIQFVRSLKFAVLIHMLKKHNLQSSLKLLQKSRCVQ